MSKEIRDAKMMVEALNALPEEKRRAIYWIIDHIDFAEQITEREKLSEAETEALIASAKEKNDNLMWALLIYKQQKDRKQVSWLD